MNILNNFNGQYIVHELQTKHACSIPILDETTRKILADQARRETYHQQEEYLPSGVREQLASCKDFSGESDFLVLRDDLEKVLNATLEEVRPFPFSSPIRLNELCLQKYAAGSIGITPHMDFKRCINLVTVLVLDGKGRFCICDDRQGANSVEIDARPGNLILMRGPGFMGSGFRPFHFIDQITEERYTLGLRQVAT